MTASEVLRARVDKSFAKKVQRWAKDHDTDVSEAIRIALRKLLQEQDRAKRLAKIKADMDEAEALGLFDPPSGPYKAGGFK